MENPWYKKFRETHNLVWCEEDFSEWMKVLDRDLPFYKKHIPSGGRVLDCGCGFGSAAVPLSHHFKVVGVDAGEKVLACAVENGRNFGGDIEFRLLDVFDIEKEFGRDSFDACLSGGVLEHFPGGRYQKALGSAASGRARCLILCSHWSGR